MTKIIAFSGSLRKDSWNTRLLKTLASLAPAGTEVTQVSIEDIPLYNGDLDNDEDFPAAVRELQDTLADADGWLIVSPEYNHSIPGVVKNTIDWLSRGGGKDKIKGLPTALAGATPGRSGTRYAQIAWLAVFQTIGVDFWANGQLNIGGVHNVYGDDGQLEASTQQVCADYMAGFVDYIKARG